MFGLGTLVNTIAVVAGGIIGLLFKNGLKNRYQETIMQGIGLAVLFVGISGAMTGMLKISKSIIESTGSLILVLSLCFGALIGEFINIEKRIEQFGSYLKNKVKSNDSKFIDGFVSTSLVICVGHAKLRPVQLPQRSCRQIRKVPPFIPDVAPRHHAAASEQPHGSFQQRGFPAAAFSNNSENLAGAQRKAHILYCRNSVVGNVHMVISQ